MRALRIDQGMVINFPQHQALGSNVEIYDCQLAGNFTITKLTPEDRARVDMGDYGPAPRGERKRQNMLSYKDYQQEYEKIDELPAFHVDDRNSADEEDDMPPLKLARHEKPQNPCHEKPQNPCHEKPQNPRQENPQNPRQENPQNPRQENPQNPQNP
jgi:hypothetical protein